MGLVKNEKLVETFVADRSDPPLGKSIRVGSVHWRVNDMDALSHKDRIEDFREFGIIIVDQKVNARRAPFEVPENLACLLVHPGRGWMLGAACEVDATVAQLDKKEHVQRL